MTLPIGRATPRLLFGFLVVAVCTVGSTWAQERISGFEGLSAAEAMQVTGGEFVPKDDRECIKVDTCSSYNAAKGTPCPTSYTAVLGKCPPKGCTIGCLNEPDPAKLGNGYCGDLVYPLDCVIDPSPSALCGDKQRGRCTYTLNGTKCENPTQCSPIGTDGLCLDLPPVCKN